jgi:hypothetical protein
MLSSKMLSSKMMSSNHHTEDHKDQEYKDLFHHGIVEARGGRVSTWCSGPPQPRAHGADETGAPRPGAQGADAD